MDVQPGPWEQLRLFGGSHVGVNLDLTVWVSADNWEHLVAVCCVRDTRGALLSPVREILGPPTHEGTAAEVHRVVSEMMRTALVLVGPF